MYEYFYKYDELLLKIRETISKIETLKETIYSVKGVSYDDLPKQGNGNADIVYYLIEIEDLEDTLKSLYQQKKELRNTYELDIKKVNNLEYQTIIRMYYLDKNNLKEISSVIRKSYSYTRKMKKEAENEFLCEIVHNGTIKTF